LKGTSQVEVLVLLCIK